MKSHKKAFGIYHWDTFDNETFLVAEADTIEEARDKIQAKYGARISSSGADKDNIDDGRGNVEESFSVT